jgi:hypothetical protein
MWVFQIRALILLFLCFWRFFYGPLFKCFFITILFPCHCNLNTHLHKVPTSYRLDSPGSILGSARFISSSQRPDGPDRLRSPLRLLSKCYSKCHVTSNKANNNLEWAEDTFQTRGALSPRVKRQGREAAHSTPPSVGVKKGAAIPTLPPSSSSLRSTVLNTPRTTLPHTVWNEISLHLLHALNTIIVLRSYLVSKCRLGLRVLI